MPPEAASLIIRPLRPYDRAAYEQAVAEASAHTRYLRFNTPKPSLSRREVDRLLDVGHAGAEALIALDGERIVAIARYAPYPDEPEVADVAIVVTDRWQGRGVADRLLTELLVLARRAGYPRLRATASADNTPVHGLLAKHGFLVVDLSGTEATFESSG